MIFKIYDSDFGIKYNGTNYEFEHVQDLKVTDPEKNKLVRGSNAKNKVGISYKEGIKDPKEITVTIIGMSAALKAVLDAAFIARDRLDVYCVSRTDGSSKIYKNAVLSMQPAQLEVSDAVESMNVALVFESFDQEETHRS